MNFSKFVSSETAPWAHRSDFGWAIIGRICVNGFHFPRKDGTIHLYTTDAGRGTVFPPHEKFLLSKEDMLHDYAMSEPVRGNVFVITENDNKPGLSKDEKFLTIMDEGMTRLPQGNWIAPLPFRDNVEDLANNKSMAVRRMTSLVDSFKRKPQLKQQYFEFMQKLFDQQKLEPADESNKKEHYW